MFGFLQTTIMFVLTTGCFVAEVWGLVESLRRPQRAFVSAGKKTKKFWSILLGATVLVGFLGLTPPLGNGYLGLTALLVAIPAFIYFADVRPAIAPYGTGGKGGSGRNSRGGW